MDSLDQDLKIVSQPGYNNIGDYYGQVNALGQQHGFGRWCWRNGGIYEGFWFNGNEHGFGRWIWEGDDGPNYYIGEWQDGEYHGMGKLVKADGTIKQGLFEDDEFVH